MRKYSGFCQFRNWYCSMLMEYFAVTPATTIAAYKQRLNNSSELFRGTWKLSFLCVPVRWRTHARGIREWHRGLRTSYYQRAYRTCTIYFTLRTSVCIKMYHSIPPLVAVAVGMWRRIFNSSFDPQERKNGLSGVWIYTAIFMSLISLEKTTGGICVA